MAKRRTIKLKQPWSSYNTGEPINLPKAQADRLVNRKIAVPLVDGKEVEPDEKPEVQERAERLDELDEPSDEDGGGLEALSEKALRKLGKKAKIDHWHVKGRERLIEELEEAGYGTVDEGEDSQGS